MRIMVACGGTGGHIFPGLAVARELQDRGFDVVLLLAGKKVENTALSEWSGPVMTVPARGIVNRSPRAVLNAAWWMLKACRQWTALLRPAPPAVLLAMGSYASGGPVWAARRLGVPVVLHEANVIPGRAIRWLAHWAEAVALGFDETRGYLRHSRMVLTGMPLRRPVSSPEIIDSRLAVLDPGVFTLLVMGGSAGARRLNQLTPPAVARIRSGGRDVQIIHLAGLADADGVCREYRQAGVPHAVYAFLHDMPQAYRRASLAVCRAGASTCAELASFHLPALMVPYPHAAGNHQMANAMVLQRAGAADVMAENDLTVEGLADYIARMMDDSARLNEMRRAAGARAMPDAVTKLAQLVLDVGETGI